VSPEATEAQLLRGASGGGTVWTDAAEYGAAAV